MSYLEWLDFVFQHPLAAEGEENWYWNDDWEYRISNNAIVLDRLTHLFLNSGILVERYREEQLEQGFWFLMGPAGFSDIAWDEKIDLERRVNFVRSHLALFRDTFSSHPLDTIVYMWWDLFESGYYGENRTIDADDEAIQEAILWTLGEILGLQPAPCVGSALHGLNHLYHPRVPEFIDYFLATKPDLDEEMISYALLCRQGKAL